MKKQWTVIRQYRCTRCASGFDLKCDRARHEAKHDALEAKATAKKVVLQGVATAKVVDLLVLEQIETDGKAVIAQVKQDVGAMLSCVARRMASEIVPMPQGLMYPVAHQQTLPPGVPEGRLMRLVSLEEKLQAY